MEPLIKEGSFLLASSLPFLFRKPKNKDIIFFRSQGKTIVKRIIKREQNRYIVEGDNTSDSKKFGPVSRKDILGKVILKI